MKCKAITTEKEFDLVKEEWMNFEQEVDNKNITSSYLWQRIWWKHFGNIDSNKYGYKKRLCIIFCYDSDNKLCAIAPFCLVKRKIKNYFYYTSFEFIGQQWAATFLDIITRDNSDKVASIIFEWLKKNFKYDVIDLAYIPEFSNNFSLEAENAAIFSACPIIDVLDYQYISTNYSKNLRNNFRKAYKKIDNENINLEKIISEKIDQKLYSEIKEVSRSKLEDDKHTHYDDEIRNSFLWEIYNSMSFSCSQIRFDGFLVAYRLNILYNSRKYAFDASYTRKYRSFYLGNLSVDYNIYDSCQKKLKYHCFGTGIDSYKFKFTDKVVKIYRWTNPGTSIIGKIISKRKLRSYKVEEKIFLDNFGILC